MDDVIIHSKILTHASCQCNQHKLLQTACGEATDVNSIFKKKKIAGTSLCNYQAMVRSCKNGKTIKILFVFSSTCNLLCGAFATAAAVNGVTTASSVLSHYCQRVTHPGYMMITAEHQTDDLFHFEIHLLT